MDGNILLIFALQFYQIFPVLGGPCNDCLPHTPGWILSPNYPTGYLEDQCCEWDISLPTNSVIMLKKHELEIDEYFGGDASNWSCSGNITINGKSIYDSCNGYSDQTHSCMIFYNDDQCAEANATHLDSCNHLEKITSQNKKLVFMFHSHSWNVNEWLSDRVFNYSYEFIGCQTTPSTLSTNQNTFTTTRVMSNGTGLDITTRVGVVAGGGLPVSTIVVICMVPLVLILVAFISWWKCRNRPSVSTITSTTNVAANTAIENEYRLERDNVAYGGIDSAQQRNNILYSEYTEIQPTS